MKVFGTILLLHGQCCGGNVHGTRAWASNTVRNLISFSAYPRSFSLRSSLLQQRKTSQRDSEHVHIV